MITMFDFCKKVINIQTIERNMLMLVRCKRSGEVHVVFTFYCVYITYKSGFSCCVAWLNVENNPVFINTSTVPF